MEKLIPCPFCGCSVKTEDIKDGPHSLDDPDDREIWFIKHPVKNNTCIARNVNFRWFYTEKEAIEAWNTRFGYDKLLLILAQIEDECINSKLSVGKSLAMRMINIIEDGLRDIRKGD